MRNLWISLVMSTLAASSLVACGTSANSGGGAVSSSDAAAGDAASGADTGSDTGVASDTGAASDAWVTDTGGTGDVGSTGDSGTPGDSGTSGDSASTNDTATGTGIALAQLADALAAAACQALVQCNPDFEYSSVATCKAVLFQDDDATATLIAAAKAGKVKYDGVQAQACLAAIQSNCAFFQSEKPPLPCALTFVGSLADGASCDDDPYCASGWCQDGGPGACGICATRKKAGDPCAGAVECEGELDCVNGKCAPVAVPEVGSPCQSGKPCGQGLYCAPGKDDTPATCATLLKPGEVCGAPDACQAGYVCSDGGMDGLATCVAAKKEGEDCGTLGATGGCGKGLVCATKELSPSPQAKFTCLAKRKLGGACEVSPQCPVLDSYCALGKCVPLPGPGGKCDPDANQYGQAFSCLGDLACDPTKKLCVDKPAPGQPCFQGQCAKGAQCNEGDTCEALPGENQPCQGQCQKGLDCVNGSCAKKPVCE